MQSTTLRDRNFAVKIVTKEKGRAGPNLSTFEARTHEEEILSKLSHQNVIGFIEKYEDNANKYLVMEYVDG